MLYSLKSHTSRQKADWNYVAPDDLNFWQNTASKTNGVIAPANFISLFGALLVVWGFFLASEKLWVGIVLIAIGRVCDVADGLVADVTKTKSPMGEMIDATTDKLLAAAAFGFALFLNLMPLWALAVLFMHSLINTVVSIYAKYNHIIIHPNIEGKLAVALSWLIVVLYAIDFILIDQIVGIIANGLMVVFVALAAKSSSGYLKVLLKGRRARN
jgi:phosphatidylglycerophosphate synthase